MRRLLTVTSLLEGSTGLGLMLMPALIVQILLGSPLTDPPGLTIARVAGAALVSIAVACWLSRKSDNAVGLVSAILFYNLAATFLLGYAGLYEVLTGVALWPAVIAHIVMAAWCVKSLYENKN
ncbi:MAG: hypothetical protein IPM38_10175 [Ignavibacteria bacterium]|nr:hypothetical protein [Ignavibacteria bacterium]